ncbi:MAG: hypothetical protein A2020_03395 [Lentisphaerae bacterium GWF2_45_14]|nr:MAG: hypothetical protein A2020_03395 [Lentisphaerae bacterium GWF2_45_14]
MKQRFRFTLLELLVVIAIIAMLASMLLPALGRAREKTKEIACLNNLKQIHLSTMNYVSDFNDWYPPAYYVSPSSYWQCLLVDEGYIKVPVLSGSGYLNSQPPSGMLSCPIENRKTAGGANEWNTWKGAHYGISNYLNWNPSLTSSMWGKLLVMPKPSQMAFFGDKDAGRNETFIGAAGYLGKYRHHGGLNAVFVDGHGEWKKMSDVPHEETDPQYYRRVFWGHKDNQQYW